jgi:hypothetical protein
MLGQGTRGNKDTKAPTAAIYGYHEPRPVMIDNGASEPDRGRQPRQHLSHMYPHSYYFGMNGPGHSNVHDYSRPIPYTHPSYHNAKSARAGPEYHGNRGVTPGEFRAHVFDPPATDALTDRFRPSMQG